MFPIFPHFKKFSLDEHSAIYLQRYESLTVPYCDFSINDALIWFDFYDDLEISCLAGAVVLRFSNVFDQGKKMYTMFGKGNLTKEVSAVLLWMNQEGIEPILQSVPAEVADNLSPSKLNPLRITEELQNDDYIFHVPTATAMQGKVYENLRRRVNSFTRHYPTVERRVLDLTERQDREFILQILEEWNQNELSHRNDPQGWEQGAIQKHLRLAQIIPVYAQVLTVDRLPVNINIYHYPPHYGWVIFNHIKSDYSYKDVFGYAFYNMICTAQENGKEWLNFEQDLGRPGLRQIKLLLRPSRFLRRYSVSLDLERKYQ